MDKMLLGHKKIFMIERNRNYSKSPVFNYGRYDDVDESLLRIYLFAQVS